MKNQSCGTDGAFSNPRYGETFYPLSTAREWDSESQTYHYRARQYNPYHGRFSRRDSVGYLAGINIYSYVGNNPVIRVDAFGRQTIDRDHPPVGGTSTTLCPCPLQPGARVSSLPCPLFETREVVTSSEGQWAYTGITDWNYNMENHTESTPAYYFLHYWGNWNYQRTVVSTSHKEICLFFGWVSYGATQPQTSTQPKVVHFDVTESKNYTLVISSSGEQPIPNEAKEFDKANTKGAYETLQKLNSSK